MKRLFDFTLAFIMLACFFPMMLIISVLIKLSSRGQIIFWSKRVGKNEKFFMMPKFRSMKIGTPQLATHLLGNNESNYLTALGSVLRRYSVDELPQLFSVIKGDMSIVGPRPALFNQYDLIKLRRKFGVNDIKPGITGWAQINGRDSISIHKKVILDVEYIKRRSIFFDIKIILKTISKVFSKKDISH